MMADYVIDASVALAWVFGEEDSAWIPQRLGDATLAAPWLWRVEVVNAVLVQERRNLVTEAQGARFLQALEALAIEIVGEPAGRGMEQLALTARPHQLSAYDALYLELAICLGLPLATLDTNLRMAAERMGVPVIAGP